ncbi:hypothetical protein BU17DRAFT_88871 [Hysterangium stoloniferum]|nr:hypothetical protein BU17DRAFT_88871 [Hysterangium stoloniferum]
MSHLSTPALPMLLLLSLPASSSGTPASVVGERTGEDALYHTPSSEYAVTYLVHPLLILAEHGVVQMLFDVMEAETDAPLKFDATLTAYVTDEVGHETGGVHTLHNVQELPRNTILLMYHMESDTNVINPLPRD